MDLSGSEAEQHEDFGPGLEFSPAHSIDQHSPVSSEDEHEVNHRRPLRLSVRSLFSTEDGRNAHDEVMPGSVGGSPEDQHDGAMPHEPERAGRLRASGARETTVYDYLPTDLSEILTWHPNRLCASLVEYMAIKLDRCSALKRRRRHSVKTFDPVATLSAWTQCPGTTPPNAPTSGKERKAGLKFFLKMVGRLSRTSARNIADVGYAQWKRLTLEERNQWSLLCRILSDERILELVPDLTSRLPTTWLLGNDSGSQKPSEPFAGTKDGKVEDDKPHLGYGFVATYNTDLGLDDSEVIKAVQSGATGDALRKALRLLPVYHEAFESLWMFTSTLAANYQFSTVNVSLEHSENGDHKARVHFHTFMGIDLSKGLGFAQRPQMRTCKVSDFVWKGIRPHISPTYTNRKSWSAVYQAVVTGAYYVAGPKATMILKRGTFEPITDLL